MCGHSNISLVVFLFIFDLIHGSHTFGQQTTMMNDDNDNNNDNDDMDTNEKLNTGWLAGIILGGIAIMCIFTLAMTIVCMKCMKNTKTHGVNFIPAGNSYGQPMYVRTQGTAPAMYARTQSTAPGISTITMPPPYTNRASTTNGGEFVSMGPLPGQTTKGAN